MSQKKHLIWSAAIAAVFLVLSYFISNIPFSIKGEKMLLRRVELVRNHFWPQGNKATDSVLFINVAYDKVMHHVTDTYGLPIGRLPITDRQKLLQMLQYLEEKDDYKYIMLDVLFAEGIETEWDSALFATIVSMPRVVIPCHDDVELADEQLEAKAGLASYNESFWVYGFTKYPYYWGKEKTMPVKMYEEITGRRLKKFGPFYSDGWRLAKGCEFLPLDVKANTVYDDDGIKIWYNLGTNLLGDSIPELNDTADSLLFKSPELTRNKYIVVGSFDGDDMVSTFKGSLSGSVVNYNAFCSLMKGRHRVSPWFSLVLFALFFVLSYFILSGEEKKKPITKTNTGKRGTVWKALVFLFRPLITYTVILQGFSIVVYLVTGRVFEVFLVSTAFYYLSLIVKLKKQIQP